jgi:hypothetical protein
MEVNQLHLFNRVSGSFLEQGKDSTGTGFTSETTEGIPMTPDIVRLA